MFFFFFYKVVELFWNIEVEVYFFIGEIFNFEDVELFLFFNWIIGVSCFDIFYFYRKVFLFFMGVWGVCFLNFFGIIWVNYKRLKVR